MADIVRLLHERENYTVGAFDDVVIAEGEGQEIIIPADSEFTQVVLTGKRCEVTCYADNCCITALSGSNHKIKLIGRLNTLVCNGCCIVAVMGNNNNIVITGPYPSIHCSGHDCTVSGALDAAEVIFTDSENCAAVSEDSITYLAPGKGTKAIANQVVYSEGEELTKGKFYEIIDGNLTEVREDGMPLDDE